MRIAAYTAWTIFMLRLFCVSHQPDTANPTLTLVALAVRLADHLKWAIEGMSCGQLHDGFPQCSKSPETNRWQSSESRKEYNKAHGDIFSGRPPRPADPPRRFLRAGRKRPADVSFARAEGVAQQTDDPQRQTAEISKALSRKGVAFMTNDQRMGMP